jgi:hypothetical protein
MWNKTQLEIVNQEFGKAYKDKTGKNYQELDWLLKNHMHVDYDYLTKGLTELGYDPTQDSTSRYLAASDIVDQKIFALTELVTQLTCSAKREKTSANYIRNENIQFFSMIAGVVIAVSGIGVGSQMVVSAGAVDGEVTQSAALNYSTHLDSDTTKTEKGQYLLSLKGGGYAANGDQKDTFETQELMVQTPIAQKVKVQLQYDETAYNKQEILTIEVKEGNPPTLTQQIPRNVVSAKWLER